MVVSYEMSQNYISYSHPVVAYGHARLAVFLAGDFLCVYQSMIAEFKAALSSQNSRQNQSQRSRPTDFHILQPLLFASFRPLDPLVTATSFILCFYVALFLFLVNKLVITFIRRKCYGTKVL